MKIQHIRIQNFVGARDIELALAAPIALFAGKNGAGKSSLREAVRAALTGDVDRVSVKKAHGALISDGAKRAGVTVGTDHGEASVVITASETKWEGLPIDTEALPFVLDPACFAAQTLDARRTFLFALTGLCATTEAVRKQLLERGSNPQKVEIVLPLLRAGFPSACDMAKKRATDAKGAWRGVTGETYGEKKAESWVADKPLFDAVKLNAAVAELTKCNERITTYNKTLGTREEKARAYAKSKEAKASGADSAAAITRIQTKLATDEANLKQAEENLLQAQQRAGATLRKGLIHELAVGLHEYLKIRADSQGIAGYHLNGAIATWSEFDLEKAGDAFAAYVQQYGTLDGNGDPDELEILPALVQARDLMSRTVANSMRDLRNAEAAAAALELQSNIEPVTQEDVDALRTSIEAACRQRDDLQSTVETLRRAQQAAEAADQRTKDASQHHADVTAWLKIADALAPDGIPGEMLEQALKPINSHLREYANLTGWMQAAIKNDMSITADDRPYALLSESEQWRVDAMIAVAIAHLSKLKLVVLDRVDVLDLPSRGALFDWLDEMTGFQVLDSAILCGTLKAIPEVLADESRDFWKAINGFWIEDGQLIRSEEPVAIA